MRCSFAHERAHRCDCKTEIRSIEVMSRALSGLADRQFATSFSIIGFMQDLLQQIDLDYYRSVRLLIAYAELEQLRGVGPATVELESRRRPRICNGAEAVGLTTRRVPILAER
jgi:hypothetical protein